MTRWPGFCTGGHIARISPLIVKVKALRHGGTARYACPVCRAVTEVPIGDATLLRLLDAGATTGATWEEKP